MKRQLFFMTCVLTNAIFYAVNVMQGDVFGGIFNLVGIVVILAFMLFNLDNKEDDERATEAG